MSNTIILTVGEIHELQEAHRTLDEVHDGFQYSTLIVKHNDKLYRVEEMFTEQDGPKFGDDLNSETYQVNDSEVELIEVHETTKMVVSYTDVNA